MNLRQSVFRAYLCIALPLLVFFPHLLMAQTVQADTNQNQYFYFMVSLTTIALGVILALSFKIRRDSKIQQSYYSIEKLLEITPDLVICVDKNGTITHANSTAKQFFGYADDLIGLPLTQLISAENRVSHAELQKAFFTGPKASMMAKGRRVQAILKDGSYRDLAISLGHSTINTQQTAVAFMRDVTQENALKRQLQNFKQRTDLACTIGKLTFWQWDKKRDVICTSTETDKPNLVDTAVSTKQFLKQFPASDRELFLAKLNFCTLSGRPETFEIQMEGNRHAVKHYRVMMAPLFSADDPESGIVGLIQDISEQQQIEYQLRIATKAAESANIAKSQFLSNMSHEIRTPMNAVSGIMTLLLNSTLPENQAKLVRTAHAASESLVSIVNDILDFSKLETGELKITQSAFNLDQILNQLVDFYSPTATSKSLLLQLDVKPEVYVNLIGDSLRLSQILGNLVNNALKFTDAGKVRVSVDRVLSHTTSCRLRFSVKDTGVGMSEEQVQTLCTPFTQLDNSTTRKHGGTGLGLTICKRLLSMMGATLVTQSAKGRGSEFSFEIDFQLPDNAKRYLDLITDTKKAMIVIEDAELEQTVTQYFVHWGIKIACFNNTKRAYQVLSESAEDFDLLLAHIGSDEEYGRIVDICTKWNKTKPGREGSLILITTEHFDTDLNLLKLKPIIINQPPTPSRLFDAVNSGKRDLHLPSGISMFEMAKAKTRGIKGARALLVEDVHTNQIVAVDMLEALGLHVAVVENGEEALNAIKQHDFDVVLMDFHMPVMDGIEATKKIRRFKSQKELAIIAMTAAAFAEDKKMALDCGMNAHISKPIQIYHLACVLAEHVHLKKSQSKKPPVLTKQQVPTFDITQFKDFVDVEAANENFSHNPRLFQSCLTHFVREFADWNEQVNDAVQQGDLTKVREAAHRLKGASANLFLTDINEQCSQLVNALDHSETAELNALQKALTRFLERIKHRNEFSDANVEAPQPKRVM